MESLLQKIVKRIKAQNGLVVNAQVWQAAHDYHRFQHQAHLVWGHGPGIVTGLEVRAERDSRRVWVRPGLAVDPQGQVIILAQQDSQVVGSDQAGQIYLFLEGTGESSLAGPAGSSGGAPAWVRDGYVIESATSLPLTGVELARVRLSGREGPLKEAANPDQPGPDELDLRFRPAVGAAPRPTIAGAIIYLGRAGPGSLPRYGARAGHLARALSRVTPGRVWLDEDVPLANLPGYRLLYLVEQGPHRLDQPQQAALQGHLQKNGGSLLVESYLADGAASPVLAFLSSIGLELAEVPPDHPLLREPFLFAAPPAGSKPGRVRVGPGVIFSARDYGRLWQRGGDQTGPSREQIRAAVEWAGNMITWLS